MVSVNIIKSLHLCLVLGSYWVARSPDSMEQTGGEGSFKTLMQLSCQHIHQCCCEPHHKRHAQREMHKENWNHWCNFNVVWVALSITTFSLRWFYYNTASTFLDIGVSKNCQSRRAHEYKIPAHSVCLSNFLVLSHERKSIFLKKMHFCPKTIIGHILVTENTILHGNRNDCLGHLTI
jgi:hypothetical protein